MKSHRGDSLFQTIQGLWLIMVYNIIITTNRLLLTLFSLCIISLLDIRVPLSPFQIFHPISSASCGTVDAYSPAMTAPSKRHIVSYSPMTVPMSLVPQTTQACPMSSIFLSPHHPTGSLTEVSIAAYILLVRIYTQSYPHMCPVIHTPGSV